MSAQVIQFCQDIAKQTPLRTLTTLDWSVVDAEIYVASAVTEDQCYAFHGVDSPLRKVIQVDQDIATHWESCPIRRDREFKKMYGRPSYL